MAYTGVDTNDGEVGIQLSTISTRFMSDSHLMAVDDYNGVDQQHDDLDSIADVGASMTIRNVASTPMTIRSHRHRHGDQQLDLQPGTYTLSETNPPAGYTKAD